MPMMSSSTLRRLRWPAAIAALVITALLTLALWPTSLKVDSTVADSGPVRQTLEVEARTRVRERYVISAPVAGLALRQTLRTGDAVRRGQVVLTLLPMWPSTLDARSRAQAMAQRDAADAQWRAALAQLDEARSAESLARDDWQRQSQLAQQGMVSPQALLRATQQWQRSQQATQAAQHLADTAAHQRAAAQALLAEGRVDAARAMVLRAPADGVVLQRPLLSERPVQAGEALLALGDPADLEVEADVLSSDAVGLTMGLPVELLHWGQDAPLRGHVARIDPAAFTKVSALGVDEQRVWVVIAIDSPPGEWARLGEGYRVQARVLQRVVQAPVRLATSAVFRLPGGGEAVFRITGGRAQQVPVRVGLRGEGQAQVLEGLQAGDRVVRYPPRELQDGARVALR